MLQYAVTAESLLQAAVVAATVYLLTQLWVASRDPLRTVPGVFWARYTRLWEWFENLGGKFERTNMKLHDKYGDVVRLSPNRYSIRGADNIKKIYGPGSKFQKSAFYEPFGTPDPNARDVFSERDGHKHSVTRREISSLYSMSSLVSYEAVVESASAYFCQQLERLASEGKRFDLFEWMQYYAFDTIGELTVGKRFGMMAEGKDVGGILSTVDSANTYGSRAGIIPELHYTLGFALAAIANPFKSIQVFASTHIKECEEKPKHNDKETFVQKCLDLKNDGKLADWNFFNVIAQNIGAGSDTTGITLSSIIFHLNETPAALAKLRSEFIEARKDGRISDPITFKEAQTLQYFQAVIKEGLRIHPAVGQIMPRIVPEGGAQLAGRFFPAGVGEDRKGRKYLVLT
jgi:cytochrome P450